MDNRSASHSSRRRKVWAGCEDEAGEGWGDSRVAESLDTGDATVERTRKLLVEEGLEAVRSRKYNPRSARPRIFDGAAEAKLIALTCGLAPESFAKWNLRLLEEKVVELNIVQKASDNTIAPSVGTLCQSAAVGIAPVDPDILGIIDPSGLPRAPEQALY